MFNLVKIFNYIFINYDKIMCNAYENKFLNFHSFLLIYHTNKITAVSVLLNLKLQLLISDISHYVLEQAVEKRVS